MPFIISNIEKYFCIWSLKSDQENTFKVYTTEIAQVRTHLTTSNIEITHFNAAMFEYPKQKISENIQSKDFHSLTPISS